MVEIMIRHSDPEITTFLDKSSLYMHVNDLRGGLAE